MEIQIPTEVVLDGIGHYIHYVRANHSYVVLKAVLADVLQELLQVIHLRYGDATGHRIKIVGHTALTQVALNHTQRVVGRDAEEGELTLGALALHGTKRIDLAQRTA